MKSELLEPTASLIEKKDVAVVSCTFKDLVETNIRAIPGTAISGQLCIPEYQRPYVWKEKQINRLLDDLIEYAKNDDAGKPLFYLGSIILHQDGDELNIIDGQQRITTLLLMYAMAQPLFDSRIQYMSSKSVENLKRNYSYLKSVQNKDVFEYAAEHILKEIDLNKINVTIVVTETQDLAYTFFETQNTGGVRLSGSDIIKAHHLRALKSRKIVNYQARKWENIDSKKVELIIQNLTKIRFWDNRKWRRFPFYRDMNGIKEALLCEFSERTTQDAQDVSFFYSKVMNVDGETHHIQESHIKQLKQPLSDGNNALDYINDYVALYNTLFGGNKGDHRVSDTFYEFKKKLMHGEYGTLFLKELLEICIVAYVSRFGFNRLFEASLWLYRCVYSLRVSTARNVRESSIFKFVFEKQLLDNILEVYTVNELLTFLKRFTYVFDKDNTHEGTSKDRHLNTLQNYFTEFENMELDKIEPRDFDKILVSAISRKTKDR